MRVLINREALKSNIEKAKTLSRGVPVSLLFKDFYEDIYTQIHPVKNEVFSRKIIWSNCYAIGKANEYHTGAVATSMDHLANTDAITLKKVFIPINVNDNREGLSLDDAKNLALAIRIANPKLEVVGMITSGCLNERAPKVEDLISIWDSLNYNMHSISLGGSYWLGRNEELPSFVRDVRIGEYMLFGTIPYNEDWRKMGENAISIEAEVIGVYPERNHVLLDFGYSLAEPDKCKYPSGLFYIDSSSEYTVLYTTDKYSIGDKLIVKPNYKSLVKLKDAVREYI